MPCGEKERRLALPVCVLAAEWESQWCCRQASDPVANREATFSFAPPSLEPDWRRGSQVPPISVSIRRLLRHRDSWLDSDCARRRSQRVAVPGYLREENPVAG